MTLSRNHDCRGGAFSRRTQWHRTCPLPIRPADNRHQFFNLTALFGFVS